METQQTQNNPTEKNPNKDTNFIATMFANPERGISAIFQHELANKNSFSTFDDFETFSSKYDQIPEDKKEEVYAGFQDMYKWYLGNKIIEEGVTQQATYQSWFDSLPKEKKITVAKNIGNLHGNDVDDYDKLIEEIEEIAPMAYHQLFDTYGDPMVTTDITTNSQDASNLKFYTPDNIKPRRSTPGITRRYETPSPLQIISDDRLARERGFYIDADGKEQLMLTFDPAVNNYQMTTDGSGMPVYQERGKYDFIPQGEIAGTKIRDLKSNSVWNTILGQFKHEMYVSYAETWAGANILFGSMYDKLFGDENEELIEKQWYRNYITSSNWAHRNSVRNYDQTEGFFENKYSAITTISSTAAQLFNMVIQGGVARVPFHYGFKGLKYLANVAAKDLSKRLATSLGTKATKYIPEKLGGKVIGGAIANGLTNNLSRSAAMNTALLGMVMRVEQQMAHTFMEYGATAQQAALMAAPYAIVEMAAEKVFNTNIFRGAGADIAGKWMGVPNISATDAKKILDNVAGQTLKSNKKALGDLTNEGRKKVSNRFIKAYRAAATKLHSQKAGGRFAKYVGGSLEEWSEEWLAEIGQNVIGNRIVNNVMALKASEWTHANKNTVVEYDNGNYYKRNKYNPDPNRREKISRDDYDVFKRRQKASERILNGDTLATNLDWKELIGVGIGIFIGGAPTALMMDNTKHSDMNAMMLAVAAHKNTNNVTITKESQLANLREVFNQYVTENSIENPIAASVIGDEMNGLVDNLINEVDFWYDVIDKYGLSSAEFSVANPTFTKSMLAEALGHAGDIEKINNAIKTLQDGGTLDKDSGFIEGVTEEQLQNELQKAKENLETYTKRHDKFGDKTLAYAKRMDILSLVDGELNSILDTQLEDQKNKLSDKEYDKLFNAKKKELIKDLNGNAFVIKLWTLQRAERLLNNMDTMTGDAALPMWMSIAKQIENQIKINFEATKKPIDQATYNAKISSINESLAKAEKMLKSISKDNFTTTDGMDLALNFTTELETIDKDINGLIAQLNSDSQNIGTIESFNAVSNSIKNTQEQVNKLKQTIKLDELEEAIKDEYGTPRINFEGIKGLVSAKYNPINDFVENEITIEQWEEIKDDKGYSNRDRAVVDALVNKEYQLMSKDKNGNHDIATLGALLDEYMDMVKNGTPFESKSATSESLEIIKNQIQDIKDYLEYHKKEMPFDILDNNQKIENTELADKKIIELEKNIQEIETYLNNQIDGKNIKDSKIKLQTLELKFAVYENILEKLKGDAKTNLQTILNSVSAFVRGFTNNDNATFDDVYDTLRKAEGIINDDGTNKIDALYEKLDELDTLYFQILDLFSGKLDKVIEDYIKEIGYTWNVVYRHSMNLTKYFNPGTAVLDSDISRRNFIKGKSLIGKKSNQENLSLTSFYFYSLITELSYANNQGKGSDGVKAKDIIKVYRGLQDKRIKDSKVKEKSVFASTYEQENTVLHVLTSLLNKGSWDFFDKIKKHNSDNGNVDSIAKGTIQIRGNAAAGKTSQFLLDLLQLYKHFKDDKEILIVHPTEHLRKAIDDNLKQEEGGLDNVKYMSLDDYLTKSNDEIKKYGLVVMDEAGLLSANTTENSISEIQLLVNRANEINKDGINTGFLYLTDDGQTIDWNNSNWGVPPISLYMHSITTLPMAMSLRYRYAPFELLASWARDRNAVMGKMPTLVWAENEKNDGSIEKVGVRRRKTEQEVIDEYRQFVEGGNKAILVVANQEMYDKLPEDLKNDAYTIDRTDRLVSGLTEHNVFIAIDFRSTKYSFNKDSSNNLVPGANRGRALLTASLRTKTYLSMVDTVDGNNDSHKVKNLVPYDIKADDKVKDFERQIKRFDKILALDGAVDVPVEISTQERSNELVDDKKEERKLARNINQLKHKKDAQSIEQLVFKGNDSSDNKNALYSRYFRKAMQHALTPNEALKNDLKGIAQEIINLWKNSNQDTGITVDQFIERYDQAIYAIPNLAQYLEDRTLSIAPQFNNEKVNARPFAVNVVGHTTIDGKSVPIVDVYEFRILRGEENDISDLDVNKIVAQSKVMTSPNSNKEVLINNLKYLTFKLVFSKNSPIPNIAFNDIHVLNAEQITKGSKNTAKAIGDEIKIANENQYFESERLIDKVADKPNLTIDSLWQKGNDRVTIDKITQQTLSGNQQVYVTFHEVGSDKFMKIPLDEFLTSYKFQSESSYINRFRQGAINIADKNEVWGSTSVFFNSNSNEARTGNSNEFKTKMVILKAINDIPKDEWSFFKTMNIKNNPVAFNNAPQDVFKSAVYIKIDGKFLKTIFETEKKLFNDLGFKNTDDLSKMGYDIIGIDADVDVGFTENGYGRKLHQDNAKYNLYEEYLKTGNESVLEKIFEGSFENDEYQTTLIDANKKKIELRRQLQKNDIAVEVKSFKLGEAINPTKKSTVIKVEEELNKRSFQIDGFKYEVKIHYGETRLELDQKTGRYRYVFTVKDSLGNKSFIYGDMAQISNTDVVDKNQMFNDMIDELNNYISTSSSASGQKISPDKWKAERSKVTNTDAYQFVISNSHLFIEGDNVKKIYSDSIEYKSFANDPTAKKRINISGTSIFVAHKLIRILSQVQNELKTNKEARIYHPAISNAKLKNGFKSASDYANIELSGIDVGMQSITTTININDNPNSKNNKIDVDEGGVFKQKDSSQEPLMLITQEQAIEELDRLLGKDVFAEHGWLRVNFHNNVLKDKQGNELYGVVRSLKELDKVIMELSGFNGKVEATTPRHEAMHIIMLSMLTDAERKRIIKQLKEAKSLNTDTNVDDISDVDALEYAAEIFENKTYKTINQPKRSIIKRIFDAIVRFVNGWKKNRTELMDFMYAADAGIFRNAPVVNHNWGEYQSAAENRYNKRAINRKLLKIFGSHRNINELTKKHLLYLVNAKFPHAKTFFKNPETFKEAIDNIYNMFNSAAMGQRYGDWVERSYYERLPNGETQTVNKKLSDMDVNDLTKMLEFREAGSMKRSIHNEDTAKAYMVNKMRSEKNKEIFFGMMQKALNGYNMENIMLGKPTSDNATQIFSKQSASSMDKDPKIKRSFLVGATLSVLPIWVKRGGRFTKVDSDGREYGLVNSARLEKLLITGMTLAKMRGMDSAEGWLRSLNDMNQQIVLDSDDKKALDSFLIELGDGSVYANPKDNLEVVKGGTKQNGNIIGVGLYRLATNELKRNQIKEALVEAGYQQYADAIDSNVKKWREFFDSMFFYYRNVIGNNVTNAEWEQGQLMLVEMYENENKLTRGNVRREVRSNVYHDNIPKEDVVQAVKKRIRYDIDKTTGREVMYLDGEKLVFPTYKSHSFINSNLVLELLHMMGMKRVTHDMAKRMVSSGRDSVYEKFQFDHANIAEILMVLPKMILLADQMVNGTVNEKLKQDVFSAYKGKNYPWTMDKVIDLNKDLAEGQEIDESKIMNVPNINDANELMDLISDMYNQAYGEIGSRVDFNAKGNPIFKDNIASRLLDEFPFISESKMMRGAPSVSGNYVNIKSEDIDQEIDNQKKIEDIDSFLANNQELAEALYEELGIEHKDENNKDCPPGYYKAQDGLTNTIEGTEWKIVKDFQGKPKHSQGGVDIEISDKGVKMRRGDNDIKAKHGLVIPNNIKDE